MKKIYTLSQCRRILQNAYASYKKRYQNLSTKDREQLEDTLGQLDDAVVHKDESRADEYAHRTESLCHKAPLKKSLFTHIIEFCGALVFALIVATIIRQMWFEPYKIPTGSMRPTFKEKDRLIVTKADFGINVPLALRHFYFDPSLVKRNGTVTFTVDGMDVPDQDTKYFGIFPSKKQYVKRLVGKPGDSLYFYGGQIYGVDAKGNDLSELRNTPGLEKIDHVPFTVFEGKLVSTPPSKKEGTIFTTSTLLLFNKPVAQIHAMTNGTFTGALSVDGTWVEERHPLDNDEASRITKYADFFGIRNYGMCRLLSRDDIERYTDFDLSTLDDAVLYLNISHSPSLSYPTPQFWPTGRNGVVTRLNPHETLIPLQQHHLETIMENIYTNRFVIRGERGDLYTVGAQHFSEHSPLFPGVYPGTYEFYYGKGYSVSKSGVTTPLPTNHPFYHRDPENIQKLFNLGMEMQSAYMPFSHNHALFPTRYTYFRDGDLYLFGALFMKKDDPALIDFNRREFARAEASTYEEPYVAFKDYGPPLRADGSPDVEFIRTFGITMPEKSYLVLGDNHAHSADSRFFGFLPESNIRGAPWKIVWPYGTRWGSPNQPPYAVFVTPRLIIWSVAALICALSFLLRRHRQKKSIFKKIDQ